jgi:hypothetical protein
MNVAEVLVICCSLQGWHDVMPVMRIISEALHWQPYLGAFPPTSRHSVNPNPTYMPAMMHNNASFVMWNLAFSAPDKVNSSSKCSKCNTCWLSQMNLTAAVTLENLQLLI